MDTVELFALLGAAVLLVGVFASRLHPSLGKYRLLLILIGLVAMVLSLGPGFVAGLVEGARGVASDARTP